MNLYGREYDWNFQLDQPETEAKVFDFDSF